MMISVRVKNAPTADRCAARANMGSETHFSEDGVRDSFLG
jgi:hypothetical protein